MLNKESWEKKDAIVLNNVKNAGSMDSQIDTAFPFHFKSKAHIKREKYH